MKQRLHMPDIIVENAINGYIIEQRKTGYDWINRWVAESIEQLCSIITTICKNHEEEEIAHREAQDLDSIRTD